MAGIEEVHWEGILLALSENPTLPVAFAWAAVPDGEHQGLIAVSVRVGEEIQLWTYNYDRLVIATETLPASEIAARLSTGRVTPAPEGPFTFAVPQANEGASIWHVSDLDVGMFGPYPTPCLYFNVQIPDGHLRMQHSRLHDPVSGRGQPYYPKATDALLEILFGVTGDQGRRSLTSEIVVRMPYRYGHIEGLDFVDGQGLRVLLGATDATGLPGHDLQVAWKVALTDTKLTRHRADVQGPGPYPVQLEAEPAYVAVGLMNSNGVVVDSRERRAQPSPYPAYSQPLPSLALPEALDFLNSAWLNVFKHPLLRVRQMAEVAGLAVEVQSRSDFESRLSYLADIMKSLEVGDRLIEPAKVGQLKDEATLERLESALKVKLTGADLAAATAAVGILRDTNRMRIALEHGKARPDLATLAAKLYLPPPPQWPEMWDALRYRLVEALAEIRRALLSTI